MKLLCIWTVCCLVFLADRSRGELYLVPSNPPPVVQLAWNASASPNIINYLIYCGTASRLYTTNYAAGTNLTLSISNLTRGVTYYFTATAKDSAGLESDWCNEVSWMPALPPAPPAMKQVVALVVQTKLSATNGSWADSGMDWSIPPGNPEQLFRLRVALQTAPQLGVLPAKPADLPAPPPNPGN